MDQKRRKRRESLYPVRRHAPSPSAGRKEEKTRQRRPLPDQGRSVSSRRRRAQQKETSLRWSEVLRILLIAALIAFFISQFIISSAYIDGQSMSNSLHDGDRVLVLKWGQSADTLQRGDIIVFHAPDDDKDYIKRVIGLPNEYVEIDNGLVYINGNRLNEDYISTAYTGSDGENSWFVPEDCVFVMGDNRKKGASRDSRVFGPVEGKALVGRAILLYYPFSRYRRIHR